MRRGQETRLFLLFEILILEDIRRGADESEPDILIAGLAVGKSIAGDHDDLVSGSMLAVVDHLVDSGLPNDITGLMAAKRGVGAATSSRTLAAGQMEANSPELALWNTQGGNGLQTKFSHKNLWGILELYG